MQCGAVARGADIALAQVAQPWAWHTCGTIEWDDTRHQLAELVVRRRRVDGLCYRIMSSSLITPVTHRDRTCVYVTLLLVRLLCTSHLRDGYMNKQPREPVRAAR